MIPSKIVQGDSLSWTESEGDYLASSGWLIGYSLTMSGSLINFESVADGDNHSFALTTALTSGWKPGVYRFQRYTTDGTDRVTLSYGNVEIKKDFSTAHDARSHARKTLDAIEAVLENRATIDQESYTINGRTLTRMNIQDLLRFRDIYRSEVSMEESAERLAQGLGTKQKIMVRF